MTQSNETFASLFKSFEYQYDLRPVFDDFLTMSMCAVTPIPGAGKSHYEDLYLETVAKYKDTELRHQFPKLFGRLIIEMEEQLTDSQGNDVLGDFYQQNFCRKNSGQFFTPWPICKFMAELTCIEAAENKELLRIGDPCCGSGRMLLAASQNLGPKHEYYGIDLDHTCVKMTALNLFLNGVFNSEVMWADALAPDDFRISYKISFMPLGIFMIKEKELSKLWHMQINSFTKRDNDTGASGQQQSDDPNKNPPLPQLKLF